MSLDHIRYQIEHVSGVFHSLVPTNNGWIFVGDSVQIFPDSKTWKVDSINIIIDELSNKTILIYTIDPDDTFKSRTLTIGVQEYLYIK